MKTSVAICCIGFAANLAIALVDSSHSVMRQLTAQDAAKFTGGDSCFVDGTANCHDNGHVCFCNNPGQPCINGNQGEQYANRGPYDKCGTDAFGSVSCVQQPQINCGDLVTCGGTCQAGFGVNICDTPVINGPDNQVPTVPGTDNTCRPGT